MKAAVVAIVVVLAAVALCDAALLTKFSGKRLQKESMAAFVNWGMQARADPSTPMRAHIFVKQQNVDLLTKTLFAVSDPASPQYGQHLSHDAVNNMVAPHPRAIVAVLDWLESHGIDTADKDQVIATPNTDIIRVNLPLAKLEELLQAEYYVFQHARTGYSAARTLGYTVPVEVHEFIDFIGPTVRLPAMSTTKMEPDYPQAALVTPASLYQLYGTGSTRAKSPKSNIGLAGFLEQYVDQPDVDKFFTSFSPAESGRKMEIIGENTPSRPGIEAMLDVEYGMALGAGVARSVFWYTPGRMPNSTDPDNEPYEQWLHDIAANPNPPTIFSISYGDNEHTVQKSYAERVNTEFIKAGVRGITLMASSGDGGVGGGQPTACTKFIPTFPAASPFLTAIGGTQGTPERGAGLSSGGFSNFWDRAAYQKPFVDQYFKVATNLPPADRYNATGAAFPDISAQAVGFSIVISGFTTGVSGTSCSSPTVAGIFALLNDLRYQAGKSTLGFLNPLLYSNPGAFNDITAGNNPGCGTQGFYAAPGWDPVTGLGTPNYPKLAAVVQALP